MLLFTIFDSKLGDDVTIYVGQSKEENWSLIDKSKQNDIWFHLADHPSCHVVINLAEHKNKDKDKKNREIISNKTIYYVASLCKEHSKLKKIKKITVIYTEIKYIKKGKEIGSVYTKKTKRITV